MKYMAIDYGSKRIGLAICDRSETITSPYTTVQNQKDLLEKIAHIIETEEIEAVVIGLPLNMDNSHGPQAKLVCKFAERLAKFINVPIHFQDERLSTFGAEQKLIDTGVKKGKKKKILDAIAAAEILLTFLEQKTLDNAE